MVVSQEAQKAGITAAPVMRKCDVVFNVSRAGTVSDVRVKRSSYSPQFDSVVVDTIKRLSGKPYFRPPAAAESETIEFNTSIELLVKEFGREP